MKQEIYDKYIKGKEYMEAADQMGCDLFQSYLVTELDSIDDQLELVAEGSKEYNELLQRKKIINEVREAYLNLVNEIV
jgi:hypothetical protein